MSNIGNANIGIGIDMTKIQPQLNEIFNMLAQSMEKLHEVLNIKPDVKTDEVKQGLDGIGRNADEAGNHVQKLGEKGTESIDKLMKFEVIKGAIEGLKQAFEGVKNYVMGFVDDFAEADLAVNKLRGGLERIGQGGFFDILIKQTSELSKITPFDDDDIANMQSMLLTFDGISAQAVQKLTPAMLNLASAFAQGGDTGMGLTQVAMLIGKAAGAELYTALQRVGIVMTDTQKKMLETAQGMDRVNIILDVMAHNGNITAEAFGKTLAGQLQIAKNEIKNVSESLGESLAPMMMTIIDYVKNFAENLQKLPDAVKIVIVAIGALVIAASSLVAVFAILDVTTGGILLVLGAFVTEIAAIGAIIISNIDKIKSFINENQQLHKIVSDLQYSYEELKKSLSNVWEEIQTAIGSTKSFKEAILELLEIGLRGLLVEINLVVKALGFLADVISIVVHGFGVLKDVIVNEVTSAVSIVVTGFNKIKEIINSVLSLFNMAIPSTLTDSISNLVSGAMNKLRGLRDTIADLLGVGKWANESKVEENAEGGTTATTWKAGQYLPKTESKKTDTGSGKEKEEKDPYKKETEALKELMKLHEDEIKIIESKIKLGEASVVDLVNEYRIYRDALVLQLDSLHKETDKKDATKKIYDLRVEENKILNLNNDAVKDAINLNKKIIEDEKKKASDKIITEGKAIDELKEKRIRNEGDETQIALFEINKRYDEEVRRIEETYKDTMMKDKLLAETKKARDKEIYQLEIQNTASLHSMMTTGFNAVASSMHSVFSNMWTSIFGEAHNLFQVFMQSVFEALEQLAASALFKLILSLFDPIGSAAGAATPGWAVGGYTGSGAEDDVAGIVHRNEFVVSSRGMFPENLPVLDAMNRGERIGNIMQNYSRSIPSFSPPTINDFEISGSAAAGKSAVHLGGISVIVHNKSLGGLSEQEWIKLVDEQILPQASQGLKRIGKPYLDNSITVK